jgi:hypothetical protein
MSRTRRKHNYVSLNIAEEEYITVCDACMEAIQLHKLASGLSDQVLNSTVIYCDDHSYVKLSKNPMFHMYLLFRNGVRVLFPLRCL